MGLKRTLETYLEKTIGSPQLGPEEGGEAGAEARGAVEAKATADELYADLERARVSSGRWCVLMVLLALGLGTVAALSQGGKLIGSLIGVGGLMVTLFKMVRYKLASDLMLALLKASGLDAKERRRIVAAFHARL
jgi:hypothetical protein